MKIKEVNREIELKVKKKKYKLNSNNINNINKKNLMKKKINNNIIDKLYNIYIYIFFHF